MKKYYGHWKNLNPTIRFKTQLKTCNPSAGCVSYALFNFLAPVIPKRNVYHFFTKLLAWKKKKKRLYEPYASCIATLVAKRLRTVMNSDKRSRGGGFPRKTRDFMFSSGLKLNISSPGIL